jgi:SAM-dependent methyltransferase
MAPVFADVRQEALKGLSEPMPAAHGALAVTTVPQAVAAMARRRTVLILLGAVAAALAALRLRGVAGGREVPGGIVIRDVAMYDLQSRLLHRSLFRPIAADIAAVAPPGSRVLEVGCGPGHLSIRLARVHGLQVTALDLDPAMIERARANAGVGEGEGPQRGPAFVVGDVASLPFPDGSFDLVVSTLSMHHWAEPTRGLAQIARVLRPGGRAIVWDMRPGLLLFHRRMPDPVSQVPGLGLRVVSETAWRWPWRFSLLKRVELAPGGTATPTATT